MPLDRTALANWLHLGFGLYAAAVYVGFAGIVVPSQSDDAFVHFRYVDQLLAGNGLVFNSGQRVEGFSSPLWVALLSLATSVTRAIGSARQVPEVAQDLGTAAMVGTYVVLLLAMPRVAPLSRWWVLLGATALLWSPFSCVWARSGMETPLVALLVTTAFLTLSLGKRSIGVPSLVALCWLRPEGPLLAASIAVATNAHVRKQFRSLAFLLLGGVVLPTTALYLVRRAYYGVWFPNTYHAKMSLGVDFWWRGLGYVVEFFASEGGWLGAAILLVALVGRHRALATRLSAVIAVHTLVVVVVSGDFLWYGRFMMPVLPLLVVGALLGIDELRHRKQTPLRWGAVALGSIWAIMLTWDVLNRGLVGRAYEIEIMHGRVDRAARVFRPVVLPTDIVIFGVGARFVYRTEPRVAYDHRGMVVPEVANSPRHPGTKAGHERSNWPAILAKMPTFILWETSLRAMPPCDNIGEQGEPKDMPEGFEPLDGNPDYVVASIVSPSGTTLFPFLVRRDVLASAAARSVKIFEVNELCRDATVPLAPERESVFGGPVNIEND